jgi:uracil-DNA glycosylase
MQRIAFIGEAWGENEEKLKRALVGSSGVALFEMMNEAGLVSLTSTDRDLIRQWWWKRDPIYVALLWERHPQFYTTNVFNLRPERNDIETLCCSKAEDKLGLPPLRQGKYIRAEYKGHLDRLFSELQEVRPVISILLGNTAAWAVMRNSGIGKIRGTVAASPYGKVIPIYHPAAILRDPSNRPVTILDLAKAKRESAYPEVRRPVRLVYTEPDLNDLEWFYEEYIVNSERLAFDVETAGNQITTFGVSPIPSRAIVVPFVDPRRTGWSYWPDVHSEIRAWDWVSKVMSSPQPKTAQNGLYDITFLWRGYGITTNNYVDDTMLLHHSLQPEAPKGLGYLGSVYTNEASWKLMRSRGKHGTIKRDE